MSMSLENRVAALEAEVARLRGAPPPRPVPPGLRLPTGKMRALLDAVAEEFGEPMQALLSPSRVASTALARQVAMTLALRVHNVSTIEIGRLMQRDHSTVVHARQRIEDMAQQDPEFGARLDRLAEQLKPVATRRDA